MKLFLLLGLCLQDTGGIKEKTVNKTHRGREGKPQKYGFTSIKELMTQNDREGGKKWNKILPVNSHSKTSQHISLTICACIDSHQDAFRVIVRS